MKGKLIKTEVNYILENLEGTVIASTSLKKEGLALSLKNCQAIENGYDLDGLAKIEYPICEVWNDEEALIRELAFKKGFQKALKILGDKKFSESDMKKACSVGIDIVNQEGENDFRLFEDLLETLQPTEWDVEIEMEYQGFEEDGKLKEGFLSKLDADGCLILKRI